MKKLILLLLLVPCISFGSSLKSKLDKIATRPDRIDCVYVASLQDTVSDSSYEQDGKFDEIIDLSNTVMDVMNVTKSFSNKSSRNNINNQVKRIQKVQTCVQQYN